MTDFTTSYAGIYEDFTEETFVATDALLRVKNMLKKHQHVGTSCHQCRWVDQLKEMIDSIQELEEDIQEKWDLCP